MTLGGTGELPLGYYMSQEPVSLSATLGFKAQAQPGHHHRGRGAGGAAREPWAPQQVDDLGARGEAATQTSFLGSFSSDQAIKVSSPHSGLNSLKHHPPTDPGCEILLFLF